MKNEGTETQTNATKSIAEIVYGPDKDQEQAAFLHRRQDSQLEGFDDLEELQTQKTHHKLLESVSDVESHNTTVMTVTTIATSLVKKKAEILAK